MALLYIDRASNANSTLLINSKNACKMAVAAVFIAGKMIESEDTEIYQSKLRNGIKH